MWLYAFVTDSKQVQEEAAVRLRSAKKFAELEYAKVTKQKSKPDPNQLLDISITFAETQLLTAFHQMSASHEYAKACLGLSSAWNLVQDTEKILSSSSADSLDPDLVLLLEFDLGLFLFFLSFLPDVLGPAAKLLSILGFRGDRERGAAYLWKVAQSNSLRSGFAYSILIAKYLFLSENVFPMKTKKSDLQFAIEGIDQALNRWPESLSFLALKGVSLRRTGQHQASVDLFKQLCEIYSSQGVDDSMPRLNIGEGYLNLMQWDSAIEIFTQVEKSTNYLRPYVASIYKAACLIMKNDGSDELAHDVIADALKLANKAGDNETKVFCDRLSNNARMFFFFPFSLHLIAILIHLFCSNTDAAYWEVLLDHEEFYWASAEEYQNVQQKLVEFSTILGINATDKGETATTKKFKHKQKQKEGNFLVYNFLQARVSRQLGNNEEAVVFYNKAISRQGHGKLHKSAFWQAHFELADLQFELGNKEEAVTLLKKSVKDGNSARIKSAAKAALQTLA